MGAIHKTLIFTTNVRDQSEDPKENESLMGDDHGSMQVDGRGRLEHEGWLVPLHEKW